MKKNLFFLAALGAIALTSCTNDEFIGENGPNKTQTGDGSINFAFNLPNATRADQTGATAAGTLGNQFIVWGEKNEAQTNSGADGKGAATAANLVFQNYQVNYAANTAFTTQSNTENWEYVGYTHSDKYKANITTSAAVGDPAVSTGLAAAQTIKYWDFAASSYTFTAVSAQSSDIESDKVTIQKKVSDGTDVWGKGYRITLTGDADPSKVFIADRKVITKPGSVYTEADRTADNTYGGNVTLTFRNILSHVRVGMYETVPGYSVTINKFYYVDNAAPTFPTMASYSEGAFKANVPNAATTSAATLDVTYLKEGSGAENEPTIAISGTTVQNVLTLGANIPTAVLGETAPTARFDNAVADTYTAVFPQEANDKNMKLKVDYTLTSPTGEIITVKGATAEVPAKYLQWKPNYKYTYLFKISENTNGKIDEDGPVGLYPITFDAVVTVAEDGLAEFITTVSEPSITTLGVKDGKYSVGQSEYAAGTAVYATVEDGSSLATLSSSNFQLYTVTATSPFTVTEAAVAEALIEKPAMTKAQVDNAKIKFPTNPALTYQNTVPAEDGTTKTFAANNVATFSAAASTKYALVYEKTPATYVCAKAATVTTTDASDYATKAAAAPGGVLYTTDECTVAGTAGAGTFYQANGQTYATSDDFTAAGMLYKNAACTTPATSSDYTADPTAVYYKPVKVKSKGVYTIKVVNGL